MSNEQHLPKKAFEQRVMDAVATVDRENCTRTL